MDQPDLFDRQSREFMCCWGRLHSTFGAFIIACGTLIVSLVGACLAMVYLEELAGSLVSMYLFFLAIASVLVFIALRTEQQYFLIPFIALSFLNLLISAAVAFVSIWMLTSPSSTPSRHLLSAVQHSDDGRFWKGPAFENNVIDEARELSRMVGFISLAVSVMMIPVILYSTRVIYKSCEFLAKLREVNKQQDILSSIRY